MEVTADREGSRGSTVVQLCLDLLAVSDTAVSTGYGAARSL